jgi:hypothetical protein
MVDSQDYLTNKFLSESHSMIEAMFLPMFDFVELIRLQSLNKAWRKYFSLHEGHKMNMSNFVTRRLMIEKDDPIYEEVKARASDVGSLKEAMEVYIEYSSLRKCSQQSLGWTYQRYNRVLKCKEYLGYGGEAGTMNSDYFSTDMYVSELFENRQVLSLDSVCWMNPSTQFENVHIPDRASNTVHVYACHSYESNFYM